MTDTYLTCTHFIFSMVCEAGTLPVGLERLGNLPEVTQPTGPGGGIGTGTWVVEAPMPDACAS